MPFWMNRTSTSIHMLSHVTKPTAVFQRGTRRNIELSRPHVGLCDNTIQPFAEAARGRRAAATALLRDTAPARVRQVAAQSHRRGAAMQRADARRDEHPAAARHQARAYQLGATRRHARGLDPPAADRRRTRRPVGPSDTLRAARRAQRSIPPILRHGGCSRRAH